MRFRNTYGVTAFVLTAAAVISLAATPAHGQTPTRARTAPTVVTARRVSTVPSVVTTQRIDAAPFGGGARIGVTISDTDAGVRIDDVEESAPAAKAGLKSGDVFVDFDGEKVRSVRQLTRLIQETPEGRKVNAAVTRGGQRVSVSIEPENGRAWTTFAMTEPFMVTPDVFARTLPTPRAPRPPSPPSPPAPPRAPRAAVAPRIELFRDGYAFSFGGGRLGVSTESLNPQLAKFFGVEDGVLVSSVNDDSAASKAGLRAGDVITKVNGNAVDDAADLVRELGKASGEVSIEIVRDKRTQTVKVTLPDAPRARYRGI